MKTNLSLGMICSHRMRIKRLLRHVVTDFCYWSCLAAIWNRVVVRNRARILAFHGIERTPGNSYSVKLDNFEVCMRYLKDGFNVVPLDEYIRGIERNHSLPHRTVILTFDDGFQNFYDLGYPILKKYQLPATCFVVGSKVDGNNANFMHWRELLKLIEEGLIAIGSHTMSHLSIAGLDDASLQKEVKESKSFLETGLGVPVTSFSYPYGTLRDFDRRCIDTIHHAGYSLACTSINGVNWSGTNPFKLRRTKIEWGDDLPVFKKILAGALDIWVVVDYCLRFLQKGREYRWNG